MSRSITLAMFALGLSTMAAQAADSIYSGGDILTMAGNEPAYVEALVVEGGRIVLRAPPRTR